MEVVCVWRSLALLKEGMWQGEEYKLEMLVFHFEVALLA